MCQERKYAYIKAKVILKLLSVRRVTHEKFSTQGAIVYSSAGALPARATPKLEFLEELNRPVYEG